MTITQTRLLVAANAAAELLPTASVLRAVEGYDPESIGDKFASATVGTLVGSPSADLALIFIDSEALSLAGGNDSPFISNLDIVRPALDAAASALGTGVLGELRTEDASALFSDEDTAVFALDGLHGTAGWLAIRVREHAKIGDAARESDASVIGKLSRINNVEMALTVEIGRTRMSVRDVLALEAGSVVELDRSAGAPADVLLNGRLIAHGEIVVVDQDYAVRITEILDVADGLN